MVGDSIADFIIRLKNASMVRKSNVEMPYSKLRNSVAQKLRVQNYLGDVDSVGHGATKKLVVHLAYDKNGKCRLNDVKQISKPGRRVYIGISRIRPVRNGHGLLVLSTPKGILTGDEARKERVGGEALFSIW